MPPAEYREGKYEGYPRLLREAQSEKDRYEVVMHIAIDLGSDFGSFDRPPRTDLTHIINLPKYKEGHVLSSVDGAELAVAAAAYGYAEVAAPDTIEIKDEFPDESTDEGKIWKVGRGVGAALANLDRNSAWQVVREASVEDAESGTSLRGARAAVGEILKAESSAIADTAHKIWTALFNENYESLDIMIQMKLLYDNLSVDQFTGNIQRYNGEEELNGDMPEIDEEQEYVKVKDLVEGVLFRLEEADMVTQDNVCASNIVGSPVVPGAWVLTPEGRAQIATQLRGEAKSKASLSQGSS